MSENPPKIDENINIERENLNIFWTMWGTLMKFSGKMWLNIKSHKKKQGFTLFAGNSNSENLEILSKFEVKEHFPRFPNFLF